MTGLLRLLRVHEGSVEADLLRYYQVDYLDRWRGGLSLRRLRNLLFNLPPDSATSTALRGGTAWWPVEAHLIDDLRIALTSTKKDTSKPHPARPQPPRKRGGPDRARKLADARRRAQQRREKAKEGP